MLPIIAAVLFALIATLVFSIDRLALSSFPLFTGPLETFVSFEPRLTAFLLFASLAFSIMLVHRAGVRLASPRGALASLLVLFASAPVLLAPRSVDLGFLAAPLLIVFAHQLSTRKYRLWTIAFPIAALIVLGYGLYPLFVLASLLLTSPLRSAPDPRLGELFMVVAVALVAVPLQLPSEFLIDRIFRLGLVFVALAAFAVFRILAREEESAHPFVALGLASAVLYLLGDPLGGLALTLSSTVLIARSFESIMRFFEVSNIGFKRVLSVSAVVFATLLTFTQSAFIIDATSSERMSPELAASLSSFDEPVAIDARLAPAFEYYTDLDAFALEDDEVRVLSSSVFTVPVLETIDDRFDRFALRWAPPYVDDRCFSAVERGVLVEVEVLCSLS